MLKLCISGVVAIWAVVMACAAWGAEPPPDVKTLVTAEVLTPTRTYTPGKPFTLAVRLKIAPEWHVYWLNPGDSGMATAVSLKLPAGWTKGDWQYPLPEAIPQAGGLIAYGYENEVVLATTITPAVGASGDAAITADAVYLVCKEICLPGRQHMAMTLTPAVGEAVADTGFAELWKTWESRFPVSPTHELAVTDVKVSELKDWTVLEYKYEASDSAKSVEVFPLPSENIELRKITATPIKNGAVIKMEGKLYTGQSVIPSKLEVLVVFTSATGERRGHWVDLPVDLKP